MLWKENLPLDKLGHGKWIKKYLKVAKALADDNDICYSRQIGCVLISSDNRPLSFGYNGPPRGCPHTDSYIYLNYLYNCLLKDKDLEFLQTKYSIGCQRDFISKFSGQKICPRKILEIPSGQRLELCPAIHAEVNALQGVNALGATLYCYCGLPCHNCTLHIIQNRVARVVCLKTDKDYSQTSRWYFNQAKIEVIEVDKGQLI